MRKYRQLTSEERYALSALRKQGQTNAEIARALGRHRSTIGREVARNTRKDGGYRPSTALEATNGRRSKSRRNRRFTDPEWEIVVARLEEQWSPEQISGRLRKSGELRISHETIYRYVWRDRRARVVDSIDTCAVPGRSGANDGAGTTAAAGWRVSG